jgi:hypothetical protein
VNVTSRPTAAFAAKQAAYTVTLKIVTRKVAVPGKKKGASVSLGTQKHSPYVLSQQAMKTSRFYLPYPAQTGEGQLLETYLCRRSAQVKLPPTWGEYSKTACAEKLEHSTFSGYTRNLRFI